MEDGLGVEAHCFVIKYEKLQVEAAGASLRGWLRGCVGDTLEIFRRCFSTVYLRENRRFGALFESPPPRDGQIGKC